MSESIPPRDDLDGGMLISGIFYGLLIGGITALLTLPKTLRQRRREQLEAQLKNTPPRRETLKNTSALDPLTESMLDGKAAARRRRAELGLDRG